MVGLYDGSAVNLTSNGQRGPFTLCRRQVSAVLRETFKRKAQYGRAAHNDGAPLRIDKLLH